MNGCRLAAPNTLKTLFSTYFPRIFSRMVSLLLRVGGASSDHTQQVTLIFFFSHSFFLHSLLSSRLEQYIYMLQHGSEHHWIIWIDKEWSRFIRLSTVQQGWWVPSLFRCKSCYTSCWSLRRTTQYIRVTCFRVYFSHRKTNQQYWSATSEVE